MSSLKDILIQSGRLTEIQNILDTLNVIKDETMPIATIIRDDKWKNRVQMADVREGIVIYLEKIENNNEIELTGKEIDKLSELLYLIESISDMQLHNYANERTHRIPEDEEKLEIIRTVLVLKSSIEHIVCQFRDPETNEVLLFDVPNGWKAI